MPVEAYWGEALGQWVPESAKACFQRGTSLSISTLWDGTLRRERLYHFRLIRIIKNCVSLSKLVRILG